jgi:hypothetical protein
MSPTSLRERVETQAVAPRYGVFLGLGGVLTLVGLLLFILTATGPQADRAWHLFHVNWLFFTGLAGGSVAFAAVQKVTKGHWSGLIIRFAEACSAFLPVSFLGFLVIFSVGYPHIYPAMEGLPHGKALWLSHGWMFWRIFLSLGLLYWLGFRLIRADLVPDLYGLQGLVTGRRARLWTSLLRGFDGSAEAVARNDETIYRLAPAYVVTYAMVLTVVAFDGIMALQPHWYSNLLGGFFFMGSFLGAHMLLALLMLVGGRELGIGGLISPKQRHDLGKLCFGFTVFWAYLMFAQFLVIWYGNLPEETGFVFTRLWGPWLPIGRAVFLGMFLIPFFGLLGVMPKKLPLTLGLFTSISLVSLWLERYLLVVPSITAESGPRFGLPELGPTLLFTGLFLLSYGVFSRLFPMISPRLAEITLNRERGHVHYALEFEHEEGARDYVSPEAMERRRRSR